MTLSSDDLQRIRLSYDLVTREPRRYSDIFYHRLLERHAFARALFPDDMTHQVKVFRQTLDALVGQLDDIPSLRPTLAQLARRHVGYGVKQVHYAMVGEVLIDTFSEILGDGFSPEQRVAWEALYSEISSIMIDAAYG